MTESDLKIKIGQADKTRVFDLTEDLRKAFEKILNEYHEDVPFIDAFMAVHNFHKLVVLDLIDRQGLTGNAKKIFKKMAVDTFTTGMRQQ
jgi:hypothetical protein